MLVQKITDHIAQALNRLMEQYKNKPRMVAILTSLVKQIQDLEDAVYDLDHGRQLFDGTDFPAIGQQLDGIGEIVGILRNGLTDAEYLLFILGKIAENYSDTTQSVILNVAQILYNTSDVFLKDIEPAAVAIEIADPLVEPRLFDLVRRMIERSLGATIPIDYIATFHGDHVFRFTSIGGPKKGGGFSDLNNPSHGGGFANLIYQRPEDGHAGMPEFMALTEDDESLITEAGEFIFF